jgi:uncharacterized membrane protein YheB (UPF0754 family)
MCGEFSVRWKVVVDKGSTFEKRCFAALEIFCFPMSMGTIFVLLPLVVMLPEVGVVIPPALTEYMMPVVLAASIGYLTNWLALIMIFRPYQPVKWLILWRQGLIPRNKANVAEKLGHQVGNRLLNPEKLSNELCQKVIEFLEKPEVMRGIRSRFQGMLAKHEEQILSFLIPQIERSLLQAVGRLITSSNLKSFWDNTLAEKLSDREVRDKIAQKIVEVGRNHAPQFTAVIREKLRSHLMRRLQTKLPLGIGAGAITELIMEFFADEERIKSMITDWLGDENTQNSLHEKLLIIREEVEKWLNSAESKDKMKGFAEDVRRKLETFLVSYLRVEIPEMAKGVINSKSIWDWVEYELLPKSRSSFVEFVNDNREQIMNNLKLDERIETAINNQSVKDFHDMISRIAAQHLGAIQVLGFVLGGIVGALQLLY